MKMNVGRFAPPISLLRQVLSAWFSSAPGYRLPGAEFIVMAKDEVMRLDATARHQTLRVTKGTLWLTGNGTGDVLLRGGETFRLDANGPFVIQSLTDAEWVVRS